MSRSSVIRFTAAANQPDIRAPARPPSASATASRTPVSPGVRRACRAGQRADLLDEGDLRPRQSLAKETPDGQADERLLAARGSIEQPPLIPAVHPAGHRAAPWVHGRQAARPGLDADRPARREDPLYQHVRQVRQHDISNIKIARPA